MFIIILETPQGDLLTYCSVFDTHSEAEAKLTELRDSGDASDGVLSIDVYDLKAAIDSFKYDPADNEFQMGYLCGLVNTRNNVEASHD